MYLIPSSSWLQWSICISKPYYIYCFFKKSNILIWNQKKKKKKKTHAYFFIIYTYVFLKIAREIFFLKIIIILVENFEILKNLKKTWKRLVFYFFFLIEKVYLTFSFEILSHTHLLTCIYSFFLKFLLSFCIICK